MSHPHSVWQTIYFADTICAATMTANEQREIGVWDTGEEEKSEVASEKKFSIQPAEWATEKIDVVKIYRWIESAIG